MPTSQRRSGATAPPFGCGSTRRSGRRRGELMALRDAAIDFERGELRAVAGWDYVEGEQPTKGRERRSVPIIPELRSILLAYRLRTGRRDQDLMFGETADSPFAPDA